MGLISPLLSDGTPAPFDWILPGQARAAIHFKDVSAAPALRVALWPIIASDYKVKATYADRESSPDILDIERFDDILRPAKKKERRITYYIQSLQNKKTKFDLDFFFAATNEAASTYEFEIDSDERLFGSIPLVIRS